MTVQEAIQKRRSVRNYQEKPVEPEKLRAVLEAAALAPTACNEQRVRVIVVTDPAVRKALRGACSNFPFVEQAPVVLAVIADHDRLMQCGQSSKTVDCSIAMSFMHLAAVEQGLQCCWLGAFDAPAVREILAVPEDYVIVALSTLGYPGDDKAAPAKKTVEEIVSCNCFGEA